ncbi:heavy metal-associated domain-containing protein [Frigoribacterium sp. CFBP9030]|uniref:heavy-metal-associated domain-containing protein n=1 Tax=Frigoribacterium sp. CFBP9030 TaxID=3096537 RepID=UPI002A6AB95B|nr:heavy metal-associated domain-containing protein [Frigoribacterium sp. CFBP9030]MDY0892420.1 heavy metal-associated domain-containing protein [Frigoribacterium sp. CFBP9030]
MTTWTGPVNGLTCNGCVTTVTETLIGLDGVDSVDVDLAPGKTSTVTAHGTRELSDAEVGASLSAVGAFSIAH